MELFAAVGLIGGLRPPDPAEARVLDLGCGDGTHLLTHAASHPGIECVGVDADAAAIARGSELRDSAGIEGVELRVGRIEEGSIEAGGFGYVIAHGIYSWVPAPTREDLMRSIAGALGPGGVAMISYNSLPGWSVREPVREIARRAAAGVADPEQAVGAAIAALEGTAALGHGDGAYRKALLDGAERFRRLHPALLFRDELAAVNDPASLLDVAAHASRHGLRYLGESDAAQWWRWRLAPGARGRLLELADASPEVEPPALRRQIVADRASGTPFKCSLFTNGSSPTGPQAEPPHPLVVHRRSTAPQTAEGASPAVQAIWPAIDAAAARGLTTEELARESGLPSGEVFGAALRTVASGWSTLRLQPAPVALEPGQRPRTSALARAQAERSSASVSTLTGETVTLDGSLAAALVASADGTRDRAGLAERLRAQPEATRGVSATAVERGIDQALAELGRLGLLALDT